MDQDTEAIFAQIRGALKSTIAAHGPITMENHGSAAKRIAGYFKDVISFRFFMAEWIRVYDEIGERYPTQAEARKLKRLEDRIFDEGRKFHGK